MSVCVCVCVRERARERERERERGREGGREREYSIQRVRLLEVYCMYVSVCACVRACVCGPTEKVKG